MARADFYLIAKPRFLEKPLLLVCELARKACDSGQPLLILAATEAQAEVLDELLWEFDPDAYVPHQVAGMGHSLGLNVIAEGVETEEQLEFLREHGCDEIQGHWLSRPIDAEHCLDFIRGWAPENILAALPLPD